MASMSKRERVDAALRDQPVDHVPVSAWRHFIPEELDPYRLADVTYQHYKQYDWDWIKLNPRATYYAEAWGNRYNFEEYLGVMPHLVKAKISSAANLDQITVLPPTEEAFDRQVQAANYLSVQLAGEAYFLQTIFSPISVLGYLTGPVESEDSNADTDARTTAVRRMIAQDARAVHQALDTIATTLAQYAAASIDAGAAGIFYALVRNARDGGFTREEYAEYGTPYDMKVLQAVQGSPFNLLHICGSHVYFDLAANYPVQAVNWSTHAPGNPTLAEALQLTSRAVVGGIDEHDTLVNGTPAQVEAQGKHALETAGTRRVLLAPGCGASATTPEANLSALRRVVNEVPAS